MNSRSFPVIDGNNIIVHNKERVEIPMNFFDPEGNPENMTGKSVFFETSLGFRKQLVTGLNVYELVLVIDRLELASHVGKMVTYTIIDETANKFLLMADGQIVVRT